MTETRVIPWTLPTIPGQATNEDPGAQNPDTPAVEYLNFDNANITMRCGYDQNPSQTYCSKYTPYAIWEINGITVNDITGLSVVETFGSDVTMHFECNSTDCSQAIRSKDAIFKENRSIAVNPDNINRSRKITSESFVMNQNLNTYTKTGVMSVTVSVINSAGVVVQTKKFEQEIIG